MKVTGSFAIYANAAALNMAGADTSTDLQNAIAAKFIRRDSQYYPYISAQAWRRWLREVLYQHKGWNPTAYHVGGSGRKLYGYSDGDPIGHEDDDLFGYMAAESERGTFKRVSPFRSSAIVALEPVALTRDQGVLSKVAAESGEGVAMFTTQHYTCWMAGQFTLDLEAAGYFECRVAGDVDYSLLQRYHDRMGSSIWRVKHDGFVLAQDERIRRARQLLEAMAILEGGAMLTRNLSDVTPRAIMLATTRHGNALLQDVFGTEAGKLKLNAERVRYLKAHFGDSLNHLVLAYMPDVLSNPADARKLADDGVLQLCDSIPEALQMIALQVDSYYRSQPPSLYDTQGIDDLREQFEKKAKSKRKATEESTLPESEDEE